MPVRHPRLTKNLPTFAMLVAGVEACMEEGALGRGDAIDVALGLDAQVLGLMMLYRSGRFGDDRDRFREFFRSVLERTFQSR